MEKPTLTPIDLAFTQTTFASAGISQPGNNSSGNGDDSVTVP